MNQKPDGNMHVIPDADLIDHVEHPSCNCIPVWDSKNRQEYLRGQTDCKLYIHNKLRDNPQ